MADEIKAIETLYNGYRFRSRLEARWAVFLDMLGVPYEYEKEGFETKHGLYLPDFWLPHQEAWFEVKSNNQTEDQYEIALGKLYSIIQLGQTAILVEGGPKEYRCTELFHLRTHKRSICYYDALTLIGGNSDSGLMVAEGCRWWHLLQPAITAATHARFEHGETPKGPRDG